MLPYRFVLSGLALIAGSLISFESRSQSTPSALTPGNKKPVESVLPSSAPKKKHKTLFHSPKIFRYQRRNPKHTPEYEFYERIEQVAKEKQRLIRKLSKPQYSDPRYFGHKRIPKRRSAAKMRYCGECGIRH